MVALLLFYLCIMYVLYIVEYFHVQTARGEIGQRNNSDVYPESVQNSGPYPWPIILLFIERSA